MSLKPEARAAYTLAGLAAIEGSWVVFNATVHPQALLRYLGFVAGHAGSLLGWLLALIVTVGYVKHSLKFPSVRAHLLRPSPLKLLALAVAVSAGIMEEAVFRRSLMDTLAHHGWGIPLQVVASASGFGLAHAIWGIMGRSWRAAAGAMLATGSLGLALAMVYIAAGRSLAPCIAAHFAIDLLIEPGIILAACRGEMAAALRRAA